MSRISLYKPMAGQTAQCAVQHGHVYVLDFDTSNVTFSRQEGDLGMVFEDGSFLLLRDFYNETQIGDLFLELPDGAVVSARDVVEALNLVPEDFVTGSGAVMSAETPVHIAFASQQPGMAAVEQASLLTERVSLLGENGQDTFHPGGPVDGAGFSVSGRILFMGGEEAHDAPSYALLRAGLHADDQGSDTLLTPGQQGDGLFGNPFFTTHGEADQPELSRSLLTDSSPFSTFHAHASAEEKNVPEAHADSRDPDSMDDGLPGLAVFSPGFSRGADLLVLEDLLDTSMPGLSAGAEHVPAFEELFQPSQDDGFHVRFDTFVYPEMDAVNNIATADAADDSSDQLILAFLRMGSL